MIGLRKSAVSVVSDLLDIQRKALLSGDIDKLDGMEVALDRAFSRLKREGAGLSDLEQVTAAAKRNANLLQAAKAGVTQVRAHLGTARQTTLTTYDASGQTRPGGQAPSRTLARG